LSSDPSSQQTNAAGQQSAPDPTGQQVGKAAAPEQQSAREPAAQQDGKPAEQLKSREPAGQQMVEMGVLKPPLPLVQQAPLEGAHEPRTATEPGAQQLSPFRQMPPPVEEAQQNVPAGAQDRVLPSD
jgi:hypothetical protein